MYRPLPEQIQIVALRRLVAQGDLVVPVKRRHLDVAAVAAPALTFGGRPGIGLDNRAFWPPLAKSASQRKTAARGTPAARAADEMVGRSR